MEKRAICARDLLELTVPGDVRISPDGETVYWTERYIAGEPLKPLSRLMRCRRGGRPTTFTSDGRSDQSPRVSHDGRRVAFLRTDPLAKAEGPKKTSLCVIASDGGESRAVVAEAGAFGPPAWLSDGRTVVVSFRRADELPEGETTPRSIRVDRLHYKEDGVGYLPQDRFSLYRIDVDAEAPSLIPITDPDGDWDDLSPVVSPTGDRVAFLSYRRDDRDRKPENSDVFVVAATGGDAVQCTRGDGPVISMAWAPDGTWLAAVGSPGPANEFLARNNAELFRVDASGGRAEIPLTADLDRSTMNMTIDDIWGLEGWGQPPVFSGSGEVWFPLSDRGSTRIGALSLDTGEIRTVFDPGVVIGFDCSPDSRRTVVLSTTNDEPGRIDVVDASGKIQPLAWPLADWCSQVEIRRPIELSCSAPGGPEIQGWLLLPEGPGPHPLLLDVHGGPMCQFGKGFFHEVQWLAAEGFAVLYANPRGSQGYGRDFAAAIHRDWGDPPFADLMAMVDHALARYPDVLDAERLGVMGGSYGGFMTNWIVGHTDRFVAACTQRTVAYMDAMLWDDFGAGWGDFLGALPWEDRDLYDRLSPATYLGNVDTPLLILQGLADLRTPADQGERLFVHLRLLGKPAEMVLFPGGTHDLSRNGPPLQRIERLEVIKEWFGRWLLTKDRS